MLDRIAKTLRLPTVRLAGSVLLSLATAPAHAQAPPPISPAQFDPSDVYFQGYLSSRAAEQLEANGDFIAAAEKLENARKLFEAVRRYYPDWKPEMVTGRSAQTSEAEMRIHPKAEEQRKRNRSVVAELEGGVKQSGTLIDPAQGVVPLTPGILEVDPLATRRLAEAEAEVKRLQELAKNNSQRAPSNEPESSRDSSRVRDIARQRDLLQSQLNAAENRCSPSRPTCLESGGKRDENSQPAHRRTGTRARGDGHGPQPEPQREHRSAGPQRDSRSRSQGDAAKARRPRPRPQGRAQSRQLRRRRPARPAPGVGKGTRPKNPKNSARRTSASTTSKTSSRKAATPTPSFAPSTNPSCWNASK